MSYGETGAATPASPNPTYFNFDGIGPGSSHPKCQSDEIFLGYGNEFTFGVVYGKYQTRRKDDLVIDALGQDRTADAKGEFFPIFAKADEYNNRQQA